MKHTNGRMSLVEETKSCGCVGGTSGVQISWRGRCTKWVHREGVLLGRQTKTQRPEGDGLEQQPKKIKPCFQSTVTISPLTTQNFVYLCIFPGEKARHFILFSRNWEPQQSYYHQRPQGAGTICPRLGGCGFNIHYALCTSKRLTFWMAVSKLEKCVCIFK